MSSPKILVIGPTGQVGSAVATAAQREGAKVFLGMRDPTKPIPGLSPEQESERGFERVQANIEQPDSLRDAVAKTGATRVFLYLSYATPDFMKAGLESLKAAGIEYVVFCSSYSIQLELDKIPQSDIISFFHAHVENSLTEVFGTSGFAAIRGGYFASNTRIWGKMIAAGELKLQAPDAKFDYVSPGDVGEVCGTVLAKGPAILEGQHIQEIVAPHVLKQKEAVDIIAQVLGKEISVTTPTREEGVKIWMEGLGLPEPVAQTFYDILEGRVNENDGMYREGEFQKSVANTQKFLGRPGKKFEQWVEENKGIFE
ncbi:hypothetical protein OQA88_7932 [Cercophora sp. LCS_1]